MPTTPALLAQARRDADHNAMMAQARSREAARAVQEALPAVMVTQGVPTTQTAPVVIDADTGDVYQATTVPGS